MEDMESVPRSSDDETTSDEVEIMLSHLQKEIDDPDATRKDKDITTALRRIVQHQKDFLRLGQIVGEKGLPRQLMSDATLLQRCSVLSKITL